MDAVTPVRLWLLADKRRVLILVWDASQRAPEPARPVGDAEGGRGLLLVEAISEKWDWYFPKEMGGKVVWAELWDLLQQMQHSAVSDKARNSADFRWPGS
jgi:hypothetical protein